MTKIHYILGEAVSLILMVLVAIAFVLGKNFEVIVGRNLIDFVSLVAFSVGASEAFERRRLKE